MLGDSTTRGVVYSRETTFSHDLDREGLIPSIKEKQRSNNSTIQLPKLCDQCTVKVADPPSTPILTSYPSQQLHHGFSGRLCELSHVKMKSNTPKSRYFKRSKSISPKTTAASNISPEDVSPASLSPVLFSK